MNAVIYARYSSDKQTEASIEGQLKTCYDFCKAREIVVIGEYIDRAISGTSDKRPEFQQMIADSKNKQFEAVIVYQLDRFARNRTDSAVYKHKLKQSGVKVLSARENTDSDDASNIILESVLEGMAEYFSRELSQKVSRGMRLKAEKGLSVGGQLPFGYKIVGEKGSRKYDIDEPNASMVREIFKQYASGKTMLEVCHFLNAKGIKTVWGKPYGRSSLYNILKNKKYTGFYCYSDIIIKDAMPRLVSDEVFEEVQVKLAMNKKACARNKAIIEFLLTTKLFCGHCKTSMCGVSGTSGTGKKHSYYACRKAMKRECNKKQVQKQWLEDLVIKKCRELLTDENIELIATAVVEASERAGDNSILKMLQKQYKDYERKQANLMSAVSECPIDTVRKGLYDELSVVMNTKQELETQLAIEGNRAKGKLTKNQVKFFFGKLKSGDANDIKVRKALIAVFVNAIYLYDDKITFILNAGDKPVEITESLLNEIEAVDNSSYIAYNGSPNAPLVNRLKTPPSHGGVTGSTPVWCTTHKKLLQIA